MNKQMRDCFACDKKKRACKVLMENVCDRKECTFYKSHEAFALGIKKYGAPYKNYSH